MVFRKYLVDLNNYLSTDTGICVNKEIMINILWADNLFTVASSVSNAQKQMDGLLSFCKSNQTIVNELKTKVMMCGNTKEELCIKFNGTLMEHVDQYKCFGNVFNTTHTAGGDMFKQNYCHKELYFPKTRCIPQECSLTQYHAGKSKWRDDEMGIWKAHHLMIPWKKTTIKSLI